MPFYHWARSRNAVPKSCVWEALRLRGIALHKKRERGETCTTLSTALQKPGTTTSHAVAKLCVCEAWDYVVARAATEEEARTAISSLKVDPPINKCRLVSRYDDEEFRALWLGPEMTLSLEKAGIACKYFPKK